MRGKKNHKKKTHKLLLSMFIYTIFIIDFFPISFNIIKFIPYMFNIFLSTFRIMAVMSKDYQVCAAKQIPLHVVFGFKERLKLATVVEGDQKAPFSIATTQRYREGATPFPGLLHFTLDTYLILLSVKQGGIKYHF